MFITLTAISLLLLCFNLPYRIISVMSIALHVSRNFSFRNNVHCLSCSFLVDSERKYMWHQNVFEMMILSIVFMLFPVLTARCHKSQPHKSAAICIFVIIFNVSYGRMFEWFQNEKWPEDSEFQYRVVLEQSFIWTSILQSWITTYSEIIYCRLQVLTEQYLVSFLHTFNCVNCINRTVSW